MPRTRRNRRNQRKQSTKLVNKKRCDAIFQQYGRADRPCNELISDSVPRCRLHQIEYTESHKNYKRHAERATLCAPSATISLDDIKKLDLPMKLEERIEALREYCNAILLEYLGRSNHQRLFFYKGMFPIIIYARD